MFLHHFVRKGVLFVKISIILGLFAKKLGSPPQNIKTIGVRINIHKKSIEKRAQKKSRDTAYKMPLEQRDRERERANGTRESEKRKKSGRESRTSRHR